MGTALEIKVSDCDLFKNHHDKNIMDACDWKDCPKKAVRVWVGGITDKASLIKAGSCF